MSLAAAPIQRALDDGAQVALALMGVVHIVRVFPEIDREKRIVAKQQRTVGVVGGENVQLAARKCEPHPPACEMRSPELDELLAKMGHRPKIPLDLIREPV